MFCRQVAGKLITIEAYANKIANNIKFYNKYTLTQCDIEI